MTARRAVAAVGVALIVAVLVAIGSGGRLPRTRARETRPAASSNLASPMRVDGYTLPRRVGPPAASVARAFAAAYARRLQARLVRLEREADTGFSIEWDAIVRLDARDVPCTFALLDDLGRWRVAGVDPPDLTALQRARRVPVAVPPGAGEAAAQFAVAYVDYADDVSARLPETTVAMRNTIEAGGDPLAGQAPTRRPARLVGVAFGPPAHGEVAASARVRDEGQMLAFSFLMIDTRTGWEADGFLQG